MASTTWLHVAVLLTITLLPVWCQNCPTSACDCDQEKAIIVCRNKMLTAIPQFVDNGVLYNEITFSSSDDYGCSQCNNITNIPSGAFANLRVKRIDLTKNRVASVANNAFLGLETDLKELLLEGDGRSDPPYSAIITLTGLTTLQLHRYSQSEIGTTNAFGNFPNLEHLTLAKFSSLTLIDSGAFQGKLPALKEFHLREAPFTDIPLGALVQLTNLKTLEISGTRITKVYGYSFTSFNNINNLEITYNHLLQSIDVAAFNGINDSLESLLLSHNNLQQVGQGSSPLESLSSNPWPNLTILNIDYNPLKTIPDGTFANMDKLTYLSAVNTDLTSINSATLEGLSNLNTLDLSENRISTISTSAFSPCSKLVVLHLHTQTTTGPLTIPATAFTGEVQNSINNLQVGYQRLDATSLWETVAVLTKLTQLDLTDAHLNSIPDNAFQNNRRLQFLTLADNNLGTIQQHTFFGLRDSLKSIDLRNTNIQTIDECVFQDFSLLTFIGLGQNNLTCDCDLYWLYIWLHSNVQDNPLLQFYVSAECAISPNPSITSLFDLSASELCSSPTVRDCPDLYTTTQAPSSTTPKTTTSTTPAPTTIPTPEYEFAISRIDQNLIMVFWTINDPTHVTGLFIDRIQGDTVTSIFQPPSSFSYTFTDLEPNSAYTFCLYLQINNEKRLTTSKCTIGRTPPSTSTTPPPVTSTEAPQNLGLIIGLSVGGVILIVLLITILYILLMIKKPKRTPLDTPGVAYTPKTVEGPSGATGTGYPRKFTKGGKQGTSADDIDIKVVSNGGLDKDRMSAGSYQFLNETGDVQKNPMPSTSKGHYVNNIEERPLPKMPYGQKPISTISGGKGYVNNGFHGSTDPLPETSTNSYSEVKY